jgi:hypothetical protein
VEEADEDIQAEGGECVNFSQQIKQSNTDEWYTPKEPVKLIAKILLRNGYNNILCPFDKADSNFVTVLTEQGFNVTYSHIDTGIDFFDIQNLSDYDAVVSNPPFSKRQRILERLFESNVPFAMIINFNGLFDSKARWRLFRDNRFELLVPLGRIHFFNEECVGNSPNFQSVFVCNSMSDKQIEFVEMEGSFT